MLSGGLNYIQGGNYWWLIYRRAWRSS